MDAIGDTFAAESLLRLMSKSMDALDGPIQFAQKVMTDCNQRKGEPRLKYSIETWDTDDSFLPLEHLSPYPTMLHIVTSAGTSSHCITVCGKWIFDSNFGNALLLSIDSLDFICANTTDHWQEITFHHVKCATRFFPPKSMEMKMINFLEL